MLFFFVAKKVHLVATTNSSVSRRTSASRAPSTVTWNSIAKTAAMKSDAVRIFIPICYVTLI